MKIFLIIGGLGTTELIIILVIVLLLFGGRKIPQLAKDIGLGIKEFKKGLSGNEEIEKITYEDSSDSFTKSKNEVKKTVKKKKNT